MCSFSFLMASSSKCAGEPKYTCHGQIHAIKTGKSERVSTLMAKVKESFNCRRTNVNVINIIKDLNQ